MTSDLDTTMTPERWAKTSNYLIDTFGNEPEALRGLRERATQAGLPPIAISADVGRLLSLLTAATRGEIAIEVGTLAGYSALWLASGMRDSGRVLTIESEPRHADFAEGEIAETPFADRIEVRRGNAIPTLEALTNELAPESVDVVFLDADKREYPDYFRIARPLIRPGGFLLADNALGSGAWWIDHEGHPAREAAHALNRTLASDPEFVAAAVPIREGLLIARRRDR